MLTRVQRLLTSAMPPLAQRAWHTLRARSLGFAAARALAHADRLHLGCGPHLLTGWANIDLYAPAGGHSLDLRRRLPIADSSVRYVYSQHFIEHIDRTHGLALLRECRRVLKPDGVVRISTPDLANLVLAYQRGELDQWRSLGWMPDTPAVMLNEAMRLWGHVFVYDEPELRAALLEAGFTRIVRSKRGESTHDALRGLETRPDCGDLIVEASA